MLDDNTKSAGLASAEFGRWRRCHQPGGRRVQMLPADLRAHNVLQAAGDLNLLFTHAIR